MTALHQPSMFDVLTDDAGAPQLGPLAGRIARTELSGGAWVDHLPGWLSGSDQVLDGLLADVPWRAEERQMYDRRVAVPRLLCWYNGASPFPHPVLEAARAALNAHYRPEPVDRFVTAGLCLYRDGADSVAWHGDRIGRGAHADTMVAILSVGSARTLTLRLPAHLGTCRAQDDQARRAACQHPVPAGGRGLRPDKGAWCRRPGPSTRARHDGYRRTSGRATEATEGSTR